MIHWLPSMTLESALVQAISRALEHHGGNKTWAARSLGISITTLRNKVRAHAELSHFRREARYVHPSRLVRPKV